MKYAKLLVIALAVAAFAILGARGGDMVHAQSALPAPTNVQADNGPNSGEAIISWDAVSGANFYRVGWVALEDATRAIAEETHIYNYYVFADISGATTYTVAGLSPGAEYFFTVASLRERFVKSERASVIRLTLNASGAACPVCPTCPATGTPPGTQPIPTAPVGGDYDADDDGLIEIRNLVQLDAIRYDLDGDGAAKDDAGQAAYDAAFPGAATGMGCPANGCTGYELANDLDFGTDISGAGWLPIGTYRNRFETTFDGNGHTISNPFISRGGANYIALFGYPGSGSVIKQVGLLNVNVIGNHFVGALVGYNRGGAISDSYATGNVIGDERVGGLVGANYNQGTVSNSYASSVVSGSSYVGGLVGQNDGGSAITDSYATGNVTANRGHAGGLVGWNSSSAITDSHATGDVQGTGDHRSRAGGLVGGVVGNSAITASYATGNVSVGLGAAGGLVGGSDSGVITASYATGNVDNAYDNGRWSYTGGLLGWNQGIVIGSYATGNVSGYGRVGGLTGSNGGTVTAVYSIGNVSLLPASNQANHASSGGLVGRDNGGTVNASYWNLETSGLNASAAGVGRTTAQLQSPTGATGIYATWNSSWWDFGTSAQYPVLKYGGLSIAAQR